MLLFFVEQTVTTIIRGEFNKVKSVLKIVTEKIRGEYRCGFRRNKSTIDQIFVLRQMIEKHNEHGLDLLTYLLHGAESFLRS